MYLNITVATPPVGNGISHKPIKGTKYVYYEHGRKKMIAETKPTNKIELYSRGMRGLRELLGSVDAEEFIALVKSEQFDYTEWQRRHFDAKTPEQISSEAREYTKQHPFKGKPDALV